MGLLQDILGAGANYLAQGQGVSDAKALGNRGYDLSQQMAEDVRGQSAFQPYTVTTGLGGVNSTAAGTTTNLSPELQAASDRFRTKGMGMLDLASQPLEGRQQDIFNTLDMARSPQRDRERLMMEERMFNQGRTGVNTSMFGGTPEQFAMEKAMAEQSSADAFTSRQQAIQEQQQFANLGSGLFNQSFTPQDQLMKSLAGSTPFAQLADVGRRQGAELSTSYGQSGLEALMGGGTVAGNLQQQQMQGLMNMLLGQQVTPQNRIDAAKAGVTGELGSAGLFGDAMDFFGKKTGWF